MHTKRTYYELCEQMVGFADSMIALGAEWKQLQTEINDETLRLATVVRDSNDAITLQDLNGAILAWNYGAKQMYGWSETEALNMNIRETIPEKFRILAAQVTRRMSQGEQISSFETQRITKDGRVLEVWLTLTPLREADGRLFAIASTERDITERKKSEREKEQTLESAMHKVKILSGFLPICAGCKNIRDDQGYWNQIETYIKEHSEAEFSHSICPTCAKELYPELNLTSDDARNSAKLSS